MKKLRKILSLTLAAAMSVTALTAMAEVEVAVQPGETQAAGAATDDQAIALAKLTFDIPEELSQCDYNVNDYGGEQEFDITWSDVSREKSISVRINSRLVPTAYRDYSFDEPQGLSEIRKSTLLENAKAFLEKTVPQLAGNLVYSEEDSGGVRYVFNRYENGIRVEDNRATVYMSRGTGKVRNYSLTWDFDSRFTTTGGIDADRAYSVLNENAVSTEYQIFGDRAFPVYTYNIDKYVDSFGAVFSPVPFYAYANTSMNAMAVEDAGASGGGEPMPEADKASYNLTAEEIAAVDKMSSLIGREKIESIIASLPELSLPEKYSLNLRYNSYVYADKTEYTVNCEAESADGNGYGQLILNAETGELISFYSWNENDYRYSADDSADGVPADTYDSDKCREIAEGFIRKIKNVDGYEINGDYYAFGAEYIRSIDGIPFPSDFKSADVSSVTGKVTGYYEYVFKGETVRPASLTDRLAAVKDAYDTELVYAYKSESAGDGTETVKPVLARRLVGKTDFYALKAEDGSPVDYDGEAPEAVVQKEDETGHPAWEAFDILRDNDITLNGTWSFDDGITDGDFRSLMDKLAVIDAVPYYYYRFRTVAAADPERVVTREDAARIVALMMGWDKIIDLDIYSVQFTDKDAFTGGIGAAAILQGLGIISAGADGSFRPADTFTYGDAFVLAYNLARAGLNAAG